MSGTRCIMPQRRGNFKVSGSEGQVVRALGGIASATLLSRLLGFVRDMIVARAFGAGPVTDAFFVAFRIPNILRRLLAEGALSTAMIPVFTEYASTRERPDLHRMLRAVLGLALLALTATTVVGILGAPYLVRVIAPGFASDPSQAALAAFLTRLMFPYLLLVGLAAMATGVLNSQERFFAGAIGPAVLNVGMIGAVVLLARHLEPPILSLAIGVLVGGIGQLLVQIPGLSACGLLVAPSSDLRHPAIARITRLLLPAVFGLAAVQVMVFINTLLASLLRMGSISYLYYADRVMEFPLGVFGIALASASLPVMSRQAAARDHRALAGTLTFALRLALYVSLLDWHHPAYRAHLRERSDLAWSDYLEYLHGQVRELCTGHGDVAEFWLDGYWPQERPIPHFPNWFAPAGDSQFAKLYELIHTLQPDAVVMNRHHSEPEPGEDIQGYEGDVPVRTPTRA